MFKFKVDWLDPEEQKMTKVAGIVGAKTYTKAAKEIMKYFGEDDVDKKKPMGILIAEVGKIIIEPIGNGEEALVIFNDPDFDLKSII